MLTRPRYTERPFPPYRFIPGRAPHPTRDPDGHSYDKPPESIDVFNDADWGSFEQYLYGIDLFNHGYWWEAHEALEAVWVAAGRQTRTGLFVQGLIQIAVAHLKWFQGFSDVATRMAGDGLGKMRIDEVTYLGIELAPFRADVKDYFAGRSDAPVIIRLNFENR